MSTNAQKIQEWRDSHPDTQLTADDLRKIIGSTYLRVANLSFANLRFANLRDADLSFANLYGADLRDTDLRFANLSGADLRFANLRDAYLHFADLHGAYLSDDLAGAKGILSIPTGLPSGALALWRGPHGWGLKVGCWEGTPESLRSLIAQDEGWPEAEGGEVVRRRPLLEAALALCDAYIADTEKKVSE